MKISSIALRSLLTLSLSLILTGCLKSRAQLKEENGGDVRPTTQVSSSPSQVQEIYVTQSTLDELRTEMNRLRGKVEEMEVAQNDLRQKWTASATSNGGVSPEEEIKKLKIRQDEFEKQNSEMVAVMSRMNEKANLPTPKEAFEKGQTAYESKQYGEAIKQFGNYLKTGQAENAEAATFFRGEAYYADKEFKKAINDYSTFTTKYTKSRYASKALFKIGQSFEALGMKEDAKLFYQELIEKHPKSSEAREAKKMIPSTGTSSKKRSS